MVYCDKKTFIYFTRAQSCSLLLVFVLFLSFWTYKLGKNIVGKFTKLLRIVFHMKCFTADFKNFSRATFKICFFCGRLGTRNQSQVFQGFLWNFLRSEVLSFSVTRIHLWWMEFLRKHEKVYKQFVQHFLKICFFVSTSLEMHGKSKYDQFLIEKSKTLHKYCPSPIATTFTTKFELDVKV